MKLFTKTWKNDLIWLKWAFRSVRKFCNEPVVWHVVSENNICGEVRRIADDCINNITSPHQMDIIVYGLDMWPEEAAIGDKYLAQQWIKMTAFRVIGEDIVWNWDSDVMAQKQFTEADFIGKYGLPICWFSNLDTFKGTHYYNQIRGRADLIENMLGSPVSCEWMRCMPIPLNGMILKNGNSHPLWKKSYDHCVNGYRTISEFNIIGQFAHLYFNNAFDWRNADTEGPTWAGACGSDSIVYQHWSWGGETANFKNWTKKEFGDI